MSAVVIHMPKIEPPLAAERDYLREQSNIRRWRERLDHAAFNDDALSNYFQIKLVREQWQKLEELAAQRCNVLMEVSAGRVG